MSSLWKDDLLVLINQTTPLITLKLSRHLKTSPYNRYLVRVCLLNFKINKVLKSNSKEDREVAFSNILSHAEELKAGLSQDALKKWEHISDRLISLNASKITSKLISVAKEIAHAIKFSGFRPVEKSALMSDSKFSQE